MKTCNKCGHICHCMAPGNEHRVTVDCDCENCECREIQNKSEGLVIDETGECESCQ